LALSSFWGPLLLLVMLDKGPLAPAADAAAAADDAAPAEPAEDAATPAPNVAAAAAPAAGVRADSVRADGVRAATGDTGSEGSYKVAGACRLMGSSAAPAAGSGPGAL
jgi:hypothetical protein